MILEVATVKHSVCMRRLFCLVETSGPYMPIGTQASCAFEESWQYGCAGTKIRHMHADRTATIAEGMH